MLRSRKVTAAVTTLPPFTARMARTAATARTAGTGLALALTLGLAPPVAHAASPGNGSPAPGPQAPGPRGTDTSTDTDTRQDRHTAPRGGSGHTKSEVHRFLASFYGAHGPSPQQRERHVSGFLKAKQARNPEQDVILCARNTPRAIGVGPVTVGGPSGFGWAPVTAYWADGTTSTSTAYVALDSQPIELHDVMCAN
ncbi:hypothetical protein [Streptomyces iconiensis]|uniref:Uncharacterized protein n=1 Tax=Streptomyces iconiensis TaxID=1384038 RepID=A0ABT6ZPK4_9ACTN|nr:hypothetical protein [Streptomyces iconiensis]MDJ1130964.1 hypothetical protein [Streptomyces iconiensis]